LAYGTTRSSGQTSTRNSDRSKQILPFDKKIEFRGRARVASARSSLDRTWRFDRPAPA
jgi:hypothetical protein